MKTIAIREDIEQAPEVRVVQYMFHRYSFGEEGTYLSPELLDEIVSGLEESCSSWNPDYYTTLEPGGVMYGAAVAAQDHIGLRVIRALNNRFATPDQLIRQRTGYTTRSLFMDGFEKGDSTVIIDDIISSGSTMESVLDYLLEKEVNVEGIACICRKGHDNLDRYGIPIESLVYLPDLA